MRWRSQRTVRFERCDETRKELKLEEALIRVHSWICETWCDWLQLVLMMCQAISKGQNNNRAVSKVVQVSGRLDLRAGGRIAKVVQDD